MFKFAVITDIHYALTSDDPEKRGDWGDVLLQRAVHRINRVIQPDAVVVLGDLIDRPTDTAEGLERLQRMKELLQGLEAPYIAIPGNHDPGPELFYQVFEAPEPIVDIGPVRFVPFVDPFTDDFNAVRSESDIARLTTARNGHAGPIVALQHVPVVPPGKTNSRFNYHNAEAILDAMEANRITLALSGHEHYGTPLVYHGETACYVASAMCKEPFPVTVVHIGAQGEVTIEIEPLQMARELGLFDCHSHTEFAYCGRDVAMPSSSEFADLMGLSGIAFTEHTGQLYFDRPAFWDGAFAERGLANADPADSRLAAYWQAADLVRRQPNRLVGFEVDADFNGNPVLAAEDRERADILVGAIHFLPETVRAKASNTPFSYNRIKEEFMYVMERFVPSGIDVLAHPFRIFQWAGFEAPESLFDPVIKLLKENNVAAEINFHKNRPEEEFFRRCLDAGVKLTFGGDAHQRFQIGEFAQHLRFIRNTLGYDGDLSEILLQPKPRAR